MVVALPGREARTQRLVHSIDRLDRMCLIVRDQTWRGTVTLLLWLRDGLRMDLGIRSGKVWRLDIQSWIVSAKYLFYGLCSFEPAGSTYLDTNGTWRGQ